MGTVTNQAERQTQVETTPEIVDALLEAARYDDFEDITRLASSGISLDSKDSLGRT
ncbi:ANKYRIN REPEAT FAMILY PROTEIN, partial [Salix purpurea]